MYFQLTFRDLESLHRLDVGVIRKRVVNLVMAVIYIFSLARTLEALRSKI